MGKLACPCRLQNDAAILGRAARPAPSDRAARNVRPSRRAFAERRAGPALPACGEGGMNRRGASVRRVDNARAIVTMDGTFSGPAVAQPIRKTRERFNIPGHARELTFSCHGRMPLLTSDRSKQWLADALARARVGLGFELWAYVIMPEHVHLLLLPRAHGADIASILKGIKQPVARTAANFLH